MSKEKEKLVAFVVCSLTKSEKQVCNLWNAVPSSHMQCCVYDMVGKYQPPTRGCNTKTVAPQHTYLLVADMPLVAHCFQYMLTLWC